MTNQRHTAAHIEQALPVKKKHGFGKIFLKGNFTHTHPSSIPLGLIVLPKNIICSAHMRMRDSFSGLGGEKNVCWEGGIFLGGILV